MASQGGPSNDRISERAIRSDIETEYWDAYGHLRAVDPDALARVAAAMAGPVQSRRILPRTVVVRRGLGLQLQLKVPARAEVRWAVSAEQGIAGGVSNCAVIELPADLGIGSYQLTVTITISGKENSETAALLVAPHLAYQGAEDGQRLWALAVQLYGVRSRRNWGHGDFTDLAGLLDLAAELGAAGIALNPLHVLFDDRAEEASPYSPSSRLFLNPLYIDLEAVPEFPGLAAAMLEQEIESLRQRELVDYAGIAGVKMRALRLAYQSFGQSHDQARARAFQSFRQDRGPLLARFACFELLRRRYRQPWWEWPEPWRNPADKELEELRRIDGDAVTFFEFVQWLADQQLAGCCERARELGLPIGLYLDVAVGVRPEGFDAWSNQASILPRLSVGAPPDLINTVGQNWGLAGFNPVELESRRLEPFRRMLQASMRYAGAVRLDHIMGLKRLYVIPDGMRPDQGAYIRFPFEALLAVGAQESVRNRCIVIGEDLGTVPEGFRETLSDWGIWSFQVMLFERAADGSFLPPETYRERALVTFTTHDLPTFAGWKAGQDLAIKRDLGIDPGETDAQRSAAQRALGDTLSARGLHPLDFFAAAQCLAGAPSRLLVVAIEDALEARDQANLPGTIAEHPNWRRRPTVLLEELSRDDGMRSIAAIMRSAGRGIR